MDLSTGTGAGPAIHEAMHQWRTRAIQEGTNQTSVFGVGIAFSIVTLGVMGLRLYCRLILLSSGLGADDCEFWGPSKPALGCFLLLRERERRRERGAGSLFRWTDMLTV